jgi:hypothetical protein
VRDRAREGQGLEAWDEAEGDLGGLQRGHGQGEAQGEHRPRVPEHDGHALGEEVEAEARLQRRAQVERGPRLRLRAGRLGARDDAAGRRRPAAAPASHRAAGADPGAPGDHDGSRAWLAASTFQPTGLAPSAWEGVGVAPHVAVPTRWDLFREETDPALAAAVERLQGP